MMPNINDNQQWVIHYLSLEIARMRRAVASEREAPYRDADYSDQYIKEGHQQVMKLQTIREDLETIFFGATK